jgi:hypothetical protein
MLRRRKPIRQRDNSPTGSSELGAAVMVPPPSGRGVTLTLAQTACASAVEADSVSAAVSEALAREVDVMPQRLVEATVEDSHSS